MASCERGDFMLSKNELIKLSQVKIEEIDMSKLKELTELPINSELSIEEKIENFFNLIKNPYCFLVNGYRVQISYANHNQTLENCLYKYFNDIENLDV